MSDLISLNDIKVNFNDEDLKSELIKYFSKLNKMVDDFTATKMVQEIRSKIKDGTRNELKMIFDELKAEFEGEEEKAASFKNLNIYTKFANRIIQLSQQNPSDLNLSAEQIRELSSKSGEALQNYKKEIEKKINEINLQLDKIKDDLSKANNYDPSEDMENSITAILQDPDVKKFAEQEYASLAKNSTTGGEGRPNLGKNQSSDYDVISYSRDQLAKLDEAFGILEFHNDKGQLKRLWTRKRLNYEMLMGRSESVLFKNKLNLYKGFVAQQRLLLSTLKVQKSNLFDSRLQIRKQTQLVDQIQSLAAGFFHTDSANQAFVQKLSNALSKKAEEYKQSLKVLISNLNNYISLQKSNNDKKLYDFITEESGTQQVTDEYFRHLEPKLIQEKELLDPKFKATKREKAKDETQKQRANMGSNIWELDSPDQDLNKEFSEMNTTWVKGKMLYEAKDPARPSTKQDAATIAYGDPQRVVALTQNISQSPDMTDEEKKMAINQLKQYTTRGMSDESKKDLLSEDIPLHWSIFFALAKKELNREFGIGTNKLTEDFYRQIKQSNGEDIIRLVIANKYTPDWVLMYIAEHNEALQKIARARLLSKGWKVKIQDGKAVRDIDGAEPTRAWVWTKTNLGVAESNSKFLSVREASDAETQSLIQQKQELTRQQQGITKRMQDIDLRLQQKDQTESTQGLTTNPNVKAPDTTNAPKPPAPIPPAM